MMASVTLCAVGDIWLKTKNGSDPFEKIKKSFSDKDILFGNLETVLSDCSTRAKKAHVLYESPGKIRYLKEAGFDIVNVANNHILDLGIEGFRDTLNLLEKNGIQYTGGSSTPDDHSSIIIEKKGIKLGFLGYTSGRWSVPKEVCVHKIKEKNILNDIAELKKKCDHVVVSLHWGIEHVYYPSPDQIKLAHNLIDHGATLILGHHPHMLQGIEEYNGGLIAYSLGNFQFDPNPPFSQTNRTMILSLDLAENGVLSYSIEPCNIDERYKPETVTGQEMEDIIGHISQISGPIIDNKINSRWWFEEIAGNYMSSNFRSYKKRIHSYGLLPLAECALWLSTPFCIKCYLGLLRKRIKTGIPE